MNLSEACQSAREGNFVSHPSFGRGESMHEYNYNLYYEDGANLTHTNFIDELATYEWAKQGWYIKYPKEKVDIEKLKKMHEINKGRMVRGLETYEDCVIK